MKVTAQIDVSTPTGRRIVRELENHKRVVKIFYSDELPNGAIPLDDAIELVWNQLETKIGYDIRTVCSEMKKYRVAVSLNAQNDLDDFTKNILSFIQFKAGM